MLRRKLLWMDKNRRRSNFGQRVIIVQLIYNGLEYAKLPTFWFAAMFASFVHDFKIDRQ